MISCKRTVMTATFILSLVFCALVPALAFTSTSTSQPSLLGLSCGQSEADESDPSKTMGMPVDEEGSLLSRRALVKGTGFLALSSLTLGMAMFPDQAEAKADCMTDCVKNCKQIVPQDTSNYCRDTCLDYCAQEDRRDGLSGSVSSEGGETGILGVGTVVKGEDKPPSISLPGLDFNSKEGKSLLGL